MGFLKTVSNFLWGNVSPRETQRRRDKPYKPSASKNGDTAARVDRWRDKNSHGSLSTSKSPQSDDGSEFAYHKGDVPVQSIEHTPSSNQLETPPASRLPSNEFDANESTMVMTEHDYATERLENNETFDAEAEQERLEQVAQELREKGWAEDAISLFLKLEARGKEALLPKGWELDFGTLPAGLFVAQGMEPFINSLSETGGFRASLAFKELLKLAPRVRDADLTTKHEPEKRHKAPEAVTKKAINEYLKWAYADAKLNVASPNSRKSLDNALATGKSLPLLVNETGPRDMSGAELQAAALDKLVKLGEHWKAALLDTATGEYVTELPTLYAVISTFTVMGFVAYDIDFVNDEGEVEDPFLRTLAIFDFSQRGYDVWNSLAIAILGIHVRDEMTDLRADLLAASAKHEEGMTEDED